MKLVRRPTLARTAPFAVYMAFVAIQMSVRDPSAALWLYPVKVLSVAGILLYFWRDYDELAGQALPSLAESAVAIAAGIFVYMAWIHADWEWAVQGERLGYDPYRAGAGSGHVLAGGRLLGAVVVVPIMEELFWRSFLMRYVMSARFETVALGSLTPGAFAITVVLFGVEHHEWVAGMIAGAVYTWLIVRTRSLWPAVIAHGSTNLALGVYVLWTGRWEWW